MYLPPEIICKIFEYVILDDLVLVSELLGSKTYYKIIRSMLNAYILTHNNRLNPTYYLRSQTRSIPNGFSGTYFGKSKNLKAFVKEDNTVWHSDICVEPLPGFIILCVHDFHQHDAMEIYCGDHNRLKEYY